MSLTCPHPDSINPLSANGFMFTVQKLPNLSFFCQSASIPSINLGTAIQENPFVEIHEPGDKIEFSPLTVRFLIDEKMENYTAIYNWINALGFPNDYDEYNTFITSQNDAMSENANQYSDGSLGILNASYNPIKTIRFTDLMPTSLESLEFASTNTDVPYLTGVVTFYYTSYHIE